jgi:hypothetical protein
MSLKLAQLRSGSTSALCSLLGGLCCKSRKLRRGRFLAKTRNRRRLPNSGTLNRVAEVGCGFDARGRVPSHLYTKAAPIARRIFDHRCKRTFATVSGAKQTWRRTLVSADTASSARRLAQKVGAYFRPGRLCSPAAPLERVRQHQDSPIIAVAL